MACYGLRFLGIVDMFEGGVSVELMLVAVAGKGQAQGRKGYGMKGQRLDRAKGKMGVSKGATRKFAESGSAMLGVRRAGSRTMTRSEVLFCDRGHFSRSYSTILLRTKTKVQRDPRSWGPQSIFGELNSQSKSAKWGIGGQPRWVRVFAGSILDSVFLDYHSSSSSSRGLA